MIKFHMKLKNSDKIVEDGKGIILILHSTANSKKLILKGQNRNLQFDLDRGSLFDADVFPPISYSG